MSAGTQGDAFNPGACRCFARSRRSDPQTPAQQTAYDKWLDFARTVSRRAATASTARSG